MTVEGKSQWETYIKSRTTSQHIGDKDICALLEQELIYNALHIGNFQEDWVTPDGMPSYNYRQTSTNMQTYSSFISKK